MSRFITVFVFVFVSVFVFFVLNLEIAQQDLLKTVIYLDYSASSAPVVRFPNCHERLPEEGGLGWGTLQAVLLPCKAMLDTARYIHSNSAFNALNKTLVLQDLKDTSKNRYIQTHCTNPPFVALEGRARYRHSASSPFCCAPIFCYVFPSSSPHRVTAFNILQTPNSNAFT